MKKLLVVCCLAFGIVTVNFAQTKVSEPEQKAKGLQKELKLTDDQTSKIVAIYKESAKKFDDIKKKDNGETNEMLIDVKPLRAATVKKIKEVLTAQQSAKYDELLKQGKSSSLNGGWSDGWS